MATIISLPEDIRSSPAVLVANVCQAVKLSWSLNRISKGSCVPILPSPSQPKAIT